jgi:hypothetical protein
MQEVARICQAYLGMRDGIWKLLPEKWKEGGLLSEVFFFTAASIDGLAESVRRARRDKR